MSPKRQQVLIVPKKSILSSMPKEKASCPCCPNCPRTRQTTTWSASSATSRSPSTSPPSTCTPPASPWRLSNFFNWIELNIVPGQCWCCFYCRNPLCHQMNLKTCKYSPTLPIILSSPSPNPHAFAKYTNMQLSHLIPLSYHLSS